MSQLQPQRCCSTSALPPLPGLVGLAGWGRQAATPVSCMSSIRKKKKPENLLDSGALEQLHCPGCPPAPQLSMEYEVNGPIFPLCLRPNHEPGWMTSTLPMANTFAEKDPSFPRPLSGVQNPYTSHHDTKYFINF